MKSGFRIAIFCFLIIGLPLIYSCNRYLAGSGPESLVIFPPPPDTTRIQFLTSISTSEDIKGSQSGFNKFLFGESEPKAIVKPYGVTVAGSKIYICDTGLGGLVIIDLAKNAFDYFIPGGKGQLQLPVNCSLDERGYLYVADANRGQVVVFDHDGAYVDAFGETGDFRPTDVSVSDGKVFVASVRNHGIYVYDMDHPAVPGFIAGYSSYEEGYLYQPTNIEVRNDEIYVSDFGDFSVKRYTTQGTFRGKIGGYGSGYGKFTRPKGIALDPVSNLYVVDAAFDNVQIFNESGSLLMSFGGSYEGPGAMWLPAAVEISTDNMARFRDLVDKSFDLRYLVFVTNQYGPAKLNIYGFVRPMVK